MVWSARKRRAPYNKLQTQNNLQSANITYTNLIRSKEFIRERFTVMQAYVFTSDMWKEYGAKGSYD
jgi:hypothetical protein